MHDFALFAYGENRMGSVGGSWASVAGSNLTHWSHLAWLCRGLEELSQYQIAQHECRTRAAGLANASGRCDGIAPRRAVLLSHPTRHRPVVPIGVTEMGRHQLLARGRCNRPEFRLEGNAALCHGLIRLPNVHVFEDHLGQRFVGNRPSVRRQ